MHESLNKELNTEKETESVNAKEPEDIDEGESLEKQDPFYIDEQALELEFATLNDTELEVNFLYSKYKVFFSFYPH